MRYRIIFIKGSLLVIFAVIQICSLSYASWVNAINSYCYAQVGDSRHCYDKENCKKGQKHGHMLESHCYKED
jgi:hypothetical protein